ncbi:hypothetical protein [Aquisphaera insulae]|uniref:hypothetical protein n=1 Tax=Aquisphaera insulae TaxID=2712864 RepID=UPI0013EB6041|nr:hypothetical protein [Aquisphaera insulae]
MKRLCFTLTVCFVASAFVGCGNSGPTTSANPSGGLTQATPEFKEYMQKAGNKMGMRSNPNKAAATKGK